MNESSAMREIRRIRDENSLRHLSMSDEEIRSEMESSINWFMEAIGRPVPVVSVLAQSASRPAA